MKDEQDEERTRLDLRMIDLRTKPYSAALCEILWRQLLCLRPSWGRPPLAMHRPQNTTAVGILRSHLCYCGAEAARSKNQNNIWILDSFCASPEFAFLAEAIWCDIEEFSSEENRKYQSFTRFYCLRIRPSEIPREDLSVQEKT